MNKNIFNYSLNKNKKKESINLLYENGVFKPTETTKFLLEAIIKKFPKKKIDVLDVGCGNGVIGIYLLKKFKNIRCMTFADLSKKAVKIAKKNCKINNVSTNKIKFLESNIFSNVQNLKFDIIINDISGISYEVAKISDWFDGVPCESGDDGTKLTLKVLKEFKSFLNPKGRLYFPLISLSNERKVINYLKKKKIKSELLSINKWPIPKNIYANLSIIKRLKKLKKINYETKYGMLIANTKIFKIKHI